MAIHARLRTPGGVLVLFSLAAGCAFSDSTVRLPQTRTVEAASRHEGPLITVHAVVDQRDTKEYVGVRKNGFGVTIAKVYPDRNVPTWLRRRLEAALRAAGFTVQPSGSATSSPTIQLKLLHFFSEPVLHWTVVDIETDLAVVMLISTPGGVRAERRYFAQGSARGLSQPGNYTVSMDRATETLLNEMLADLIPLVGKPDGVLPPISR